MSCASRCCIGLTNKTYHLGAIFQCNGSHAQRGENAGDKGAELARGQLPYFQFNGSATRTHPHHARPLGRPTRQGQQLVARRAAH